MKKLMLGAALAMMAGAGQAQDVTLQLKWVTQAQFAGYYVAAAKGFYEEEGLNVTILPGGPDIAPTQVIAGGGADVVVDTTGNARVIELAYDLTHADGRTILVGVPRAGEKVSIYTLPLHFKKVLKGSHGGSAAPDLEIPRLINLIQAGKMTLDGLVTHTFPLDKVNDAIAMHRSGTAARVMLSMRGE